MEIEWEIEDGYVGGSRPQYTSLDQWTIEDFAESLADEPDNIDPVEDAIYDYVHEDFRNNISFYIKNIDEVLALVQEKAEEIRKQRDEKTLDED